MIEKQQVIGLAGALQSLSLVNSIATTGQCDGELEQAVLKSIIVYNPENVIDAYGDGDILAIRSGLKLLVQLFGNNSDQSQRDLAAYLLSAISIELKLVREARLLGMIRDELSDIRVSIHDHDPDIDDDDHDENEDDDITNHFEDHKLINTETIEAFANLYKRTASTVEPRIMIKGEGQYLQNTSNANRIRALLLASLRGVAFYRQFGGTRLNFMFQRKSFVQLASSLLRG